MNRLILSLVLFGLIACKARQEPDVLSVSKMAAVQWDMMRADDLASYYKSRDSNFKYDSVREVYYQQVFQTHQVERAAFYNSLEYYTAHPDVLKSVIDSMQTLSVRQVSKDSSGTKAMPQITEKISPDSLRRRVSDSIRLRKLKLSVGH